MNIPKLILLPGLDGTGDLFEPLVTALPPGVQTTVVRYTSPALVSYEQCKSLVRAKLPTDEPYVIVGESFSGPLAVSVAATRPPGLCGVVLAASFVSSPRRALTLFSPLIRALPTHSTPRWISDFLVLGRFATPDLRTRVAETTRNVAPAVLKARLREIAFTDVSEDLRRVRVPVLYLRATRDRLVPRSAGARVARLSHQATMVDIDAPHMMLQCAALECASAICDFGARCRASRVP